MKVLVTGASSLLGRHVALGLAERGDDVTCYQRSDAGTGLREVHADIRDAATLSASVAGHDAVVHLAALVAPKAAWGEAYDVNVTGTLNAMRAAATCGRFVHVSTPSVAFHDVAVVGGGVQPPSYRGRDVYAHTKAIAEQLVLERSEVATVVVRPHLVWGPGDTQLVARLVDRARRGHLALPDHGRALIDSTYVDDAAAAIVAALDHAVIGDEACAKAWIVTGDDPRPVAELVDGIVRAAGLETTPRSIPAPLAALVGRLADRVWPGDEPPITHFAARQLSVAHWFDQRDTQRVLGWCPRVSVDEGLNRLAAWFVTNPVRD